jgi:hypothetical protein
VQFKPFDYLQQNLILYKYKPFIQYQDDNEGRCLGYECRLNQYWVKCYDKGLQYNLTENLMRFELKFKKMIKINSEFNIKYLHDLTQSDKVNRIKKLLLKAWTDVLLFEDLDIPEGILNPTLEKLQIDGVNQKYWIKLYKNDKRKMLYHRKILREMLDQYGNGIKANIRTKIDNEWELLFSQNC